MGAKTNVSIIFGVLLILAVAYGTWVWIGPTSIVDGDTIDMGIFTGQQEGSGNPLTVIGVDTPGITVGSNRVDFSMRYEIQNHFLMGDRYRIETRFYPSSSLSGNNLKYTSNHLFAHDIGDRYFATANFGVSGDLFEDPRYCGRTLYIKATHLVCQGDYSTCDTEAQISSFPETVFWACPATCTGQVCPDRNTVSCDEFIEPNPGCFGPCQTGTACSGSDTCQSGQCVANQVCTPNQRDTNCPSNGQYKICRGDGSGWNTVSCPSGQMCEQGTGSCIQSGSACDNDGICEAGETTSNCANDCQTQICNNNNICETGETNSNCPSDCDPAPSCDNDGICEAGESITNCPADCQTFECQTDVNCQQDANQCTKNKCNSGFCQTEEVVSCSQGQTCNPSNGLCSAPSGCTTDADCPASDGFIPVCTANTCDYEPISPDSCKGYQDHDGIECKFSISKLFTTDGVKDIWDDQPAGVVIVIVLLFGIGFFIYTKSQDKGPSLVG